MEKYRKIIHFYHFDSDPRFPPFLLYVRWRSGVAFVRKCFRGEKGQRLVLSKDADGMANSEDPDQTAALGTV